MHRCRLAPVQKSRSERLGLHVEVRRPSALKKPAEGFRPALNLKKQYLLKFAAHDDHKRTCERSKCVAGHLREVRRGRTLESCKLCQQEHMSAKGQQGPGKTDRCSLFSSSEAEYKDWFPLTCEELVLHSCDRPLQAARRNQDSRR